MERNMVQKKRGFEIVTKYLGMEDELKPHRLTMHSAGYDFFAATETIIPAIHRQLKPTLVSTGVKAHMPPHEYLMLVNRSSSPRKHNLVLPNGVGIIDADYYGNSDNEGEIYLQLINYGEHDFTIKRGDRICQGIFMPYLLAEEEITPTEIRSGGFGSSGI